MPPAPQFVVILSPEHTQACALSRSPAWASGAQSLGGVQGVRGTRLSEPSCSPPRGLGCLWSPSRYCLSGALKKRWCSGVSGSRKASSEEMRGLELGVGRAALGPPARGRGHCPPHCPVLAGLSGPRASVPSCVTVGLDTVSPHMPGSSLNLALSQGPFRWPFPSLARYWPDSHLSIPCVSVGD